MARSFRTRSRRKCATARSHCTRRISRHVLSSRSSTRRVATTSLHSRRKSIHSRPRRQSDAAGAADSSPAAPSEGEVEGVAAGGGRRPRPGGRGGGGPPPPPTLQSTSAAMVTAAMAMQNADVAPTASQVEAVTKARAQSADVLKKWNSLKGPGLAALNAKRKAAGQPAIIFPGG